MAQAEWSSGRLGLLRHLCLAILASLLWSPSAYAYCDWNDKAVWTYDGTLGGSERIRITLRYGEFGDSHVEGAYYPERSDEVLLIQGVVSDGRTLQAGVTGSDGKPRAVISAEYLETDPRAGYAPGTRLRCESLAGEWRFEGKAPVALYLHSGSGAYGAAVGHVYADLGVSDDRVVDKAVRRFQDAVARGDWKAVAAQVRFPLAVKIGKKRLKLATGADLVRHHAAIFAPDFRRRVATDYGRALFVRQGQVMLGRGEVWFDQKLRVIALQP